MLLASIFLAVLARTLASPVSSPNGSIPSPLCVVSATLSTSRCDANKTRTIFDILYSCLGVIFLCTYISIHHNIPDQNDSGAKKLWLKVRTMLYALLAPEIVIMWALRQRIMADVIAKSNWGKARRWTRTHGFYIQMGGLMLEVEKGQKYEVVTMKEFESKDWRAFAESEEVLNVPAIREREILDHGKGDLLAKAIVLLQTSWFVVQCVSRYLEGLVITEFELVTLAFAALNAITYGLWWDKPLNIGYPIYFDLKGNRVDGPEEDDNDAWYARLWRAVTGNQGKKAQSQDEVGLLSGARRHPQDNGEAKTVWNTMVKKPFILIFGPLLQMTNEEGDEERRSTSVHPFFAAKLNASQHELAYLCASIIGVVFGAIHLAGWYFPFLTTLELCLWRGSSLILTVTPAFIVISWPFHVEWWSPPKSYDRVAYRLFWFLAIRIGSPLYIAARIVILVLAFFALRDLPDSAYENVNSFHTSSSISVIPLFHPICWKPYPIA